MTGEEFIRRFPTVDDYLTFHQRAGHICCSCVNQNPPLPCCNPDHVDGYPTWTQRDIELLNRAEGDPVPDWTRLDESPAASAQMIQWHAPETAAALVEAAVPQPADKRLIANRTGENALAEWLEEVFSTGTEEGITWEAAAEALFECRAVLQAAVPQPADREALADVVLNELAGIAEAGNDKVIVRWLKAPTLRSAVLAVLAGEQAGKSAS